MVGWPSWRAGCCQRAAHGSCRREAPSALISLFRNPLPQPATAGAWDWTIVAGVPAILQQEGCGPAVFEASVRPGYQVVPLLLAFEKGNPCLWPRPSIRSTDLTQRTAAHAAVCSRSSRADSRPCAAQPRATCPARDHGDPMGPRSRRSSSLANQLPFVHHGRPPRAKLCFSRVGITIHGHAWHGTTGPWGRVDMGRGGEYGEDGEFHSTTTDSWQRPGRLPCILASSGWTPPTLLGLDGSLGFPWMMARSTGSETPSPR